MSSGITFGPGQIWLVGRTLSDPIMERVVHRLERSDPTLAQRVQAGIFMQSVSTRLFEPVQREKVRCAVVEVTRELLADDDLLRAIVETAGEPDAERDAGRRRTVQRLLDMAASDEARRFAAGELG